MAQTVKLTSSTSAMGPVSPDGGPAWAHGGEEDEVVGANREKEPEEAMAGLSTSPGPNPSPYEAVMAGGFRSLRFPRQMEARYQQDKLAGRLLRLSMGAATVLVVGMLVSDWLMVPDMFHAAWQMRLSLYALPVVLWLLMFERLGLLWREWFPVMTGVVAAAIPAWLSIRSSDTLAPAYLVSLALILLFNGGVMRMRFRHGLASTLGVLLVYAMALTQLEPFPGVLMIAVTLVLVATGVFTLYGCYWLEHEERTNWLMLQHEHLLLAEIEKGNRRLDQLSRHDALTGLANRRHVDEFLQQVWDRARKEGDEVSLLMMDIDHFKAFNDRYGHPEGDACLKDVAEAMGAHLRQPGDLVGRFGGEEFIAVLNRTGLGAAMVAAERVRHGVKQLGRAHAASGTAPVVTVSIGAACVRPGRHERSPERLIALADRALYQAKSGGRDRVTALSDQD